jgi:hypothetical protein
MEGIGRIALAVSFLEFSVDGIGWSLLTSDLNVYLALTGTMSVASKADRLAELARRVIPGLPHFPGRAGRTGSCVIVMLTAFTYSLARKTTLG